MYVIFLGAPGAGKGTQAARIARELEMVHVASGDLFRQALEQGTALGLKAKPYMEQGRLVPNEITIQMVLERLSEVGDQAGVILDGFPRNLEQSISLDGALEVRGKQIDKVLYIKVAKNELLERLSGRWICRNCQTPYHVRNFPPKIWGQCDKCAGDLYQRPDDNVESVKKRLGVYFTETVPLIQHYNDAGKLITVDGGGEVEAVGGRIIAALGAAG